MFKGGKTICNECGLRVETILEQTNSDRFKCNLCFDEHFVSSNGLVRNEILVKLIKEKPGNIPHEASNFYKESSIIALNKCQQCNRPFDPYEPPKVLALTGKTICSRCMNTKRPSNDIIFIENELLFELLSIQPRKVYRGETIEQLNFSLKNLELLLNDLVFNCENGELKIQDYCDEQRRLVQLTKELKELEINEQTNDIFIEIIDDYEKETISCYLVIKNHLKNNQLIDDVNKFIVEVKTYFQEFELNEKNIENLKRQCETYVF